ncbi:hypothetical protein CYMTET_10003, partial [Cymbomonas tetramitiformis]
ALLRRTMKLGNVMDPLLTEHSESVKEGLLAYDQAVAENMFGLTLCSMIFSLSLLSIGAFLITQGRMDLTVFTSFYIAASGLDSYVIALSQVELTPDSARAADIGG